MSSATSGPIAVPPTATAISLEWHFLSLEFDQFVGGPYDDIATVSLLSATRARTQTLASVDGVGAAASTPQACSFVLPYDANQ